MITNNEKRIIQPQLINQKIMTWIVKICTRSLEIKINSIFKKKKNAQYLRNSSNSSNQGCQVRLSYNKPDLNWTELELN